jgi:hypothetical protein
MGARSWNYLQLFCVFALATLTSIGYLAIPVNNENFLFFLKLPFIGAVFGVLVSIVYNLRFETGWYFEVLLSF